MTHDAPSSSDAITASDARSVSMFDGIWSIPNAFTLLRLLLLPVFLYVLFGLDDRAAAAFFWIFLEVPIQLPLILILFGAFNSYAAGLYVASVVIHLFESAQLLVQVVYARVKKVESSTRRD